jgi:hypothetical protein
MTKPRPARRGPDPQRPPLEDVGHGNSMSCLTAQGVQNFCAGTIIIIKFRHLR